MRRAGFTLVEMLVVIGILGILASVMIGALAHVKKTAKQSQAKNQISEVATVLEQFLLQEREWPDELLDKTELDADVCLVLQKKRMLDLTTYQSDGAGGVKYDSTGSSAQLNTDSLDRFGLLDPWGRDALRRNPQISGAATVVDGGCKLSDHRIQFRLDKNYDGFVDSSEGSPKGVKVRAAVLVWSRGPDGKDAATQSVRYPGDDRLSWNYGQSLGAN